MKMKDVISDKFILWCIRLALAILVGILLLFFIVKAQQVIYVSKMMHQVSEATDAYVESEIDNIRY